MKKIKSLLAITAAAAMAVSMVGCGKKDDDTSKKKEDEKITADIKVWGPAEEQKDDNSWLKVMCKKFNDEHPNWNLTFTYQVCPEGDAGKDVVTDPAAAGDVYFFANDQINKLIDAQAISKIGGDYLKTIKANSSDAIINSVTVDGNVYGYPFTTNTWFMYYNKKLVTEDDAKSLEKMLAKGKVSYPITNGWYLPAFYYANGCTMFGENGTDGAKGIDFDNDKGVEVTKYLMNLVKNKNFFNDDQGTGIAAMRDGSAVAMFSGAWDAKPLKEALGDNLGVAVLPTANIGGKDVQLKSFAGSKAIAVNPHTKQPVVANALAAYLTSADAQKSHYELNNVIPSNTKLSNDDAMKKDPVFTVQNEVFNKCSKMQPFVNEMNGFWDPAAALAKGIINNEVTDANVQQKMKDFVKSAKELS